METEIKTEMKTYTKKPRTIRVKHGERHLWSLFHPYHYMTLDKDEEKSLASGASFYTFYLYEDDIETLFGCVGVIPQISKQPARRLTRLVILPEFQGMGLLSACIDYISQYYHEKGIKMYSATFHPRLGSHQENSELWKPSSNNMKEHRTTSENFERGLGAQTGLRDGQAMFRYNYNPDNDKPIPTYELKYDLLEILSLKSKIQKCKDKNERSKLRKKVQELEEPLHTMQKEIDSPSTDVDMVDDKTLQETKTKLKSIFKPKRKPLSADERRKLKEKRRKQNVI